MKLYLYHKWGVLGGVCLLASSMWAAPATHVQTFYPSTQTEVRHPATSGVVRQPGTTVAVSKPATSVRVTQQETSVPVKQNTTSVAVNKPATTTPVRQLTTTVTVDKPTTTVQVMHPGEPDWQNATGKYTNTFPAAPSRGSADVSKKAPSMMDSYQPPQAKNLKAAKTGGGEEGLGNKVNQAEKDAAAAALNIPKGEEVSLENVLKSSEKDMSKLKQNVEKKVK